MLKWTFLFILVAISGSFRFKTDSKATLKIELENIRNLKGNLLISIFASEEGFPENEKKSFKSWVLKPEKKLDLGHIPTGRYALALLHDEDENYKMTFNFFRLPKEGFAFSNNQASLLKRPDFKTAVFLHGEQGTRLSLKVIY